MRISIFKSEVVTGVGFVLDIRNYYDGIYDMIATLFYNDFVIHELRQVSIISCDQDRDHYLNSSEEYGRDDCDDRRHSINPEMPDYYGDGIDTNCDGIDRTDANGNGYPYDAIFYDVSKKDCNDNDPSVHPDAKDELGDNIDKNCDGKDG